MVSQPTDFLPRSHMDPGPSGLEHSEPLPGVTDTIAPQTAIDSRQGARPSLGNPLLTGRTDDIESVLDVAAPIMAPAKTGRDCPWRDAMGLFRIAARWIDEVQFPKDGPHAAGSDAIELA